ncbi:hypothetical protein T484DRAFT_1916266 [Baffinella frigidus]|nr:hypothetical protein T484DRAFT_1916266 [Cryptophyta sp. CCMP2293]
MAIRTPRAVVEAQRPKSKSEADIYGGLLEDMRGKVGADSNIRKGEGDTPTPTDTPPSLTPVKVDDKVDPDRDTQVRQGHGQDSPLTPAGQGPIAAMRAQARQAQGRQTRHGEGSPLASAVGAGWQEASEERQEPGEVSQESSAAWEQHSAASHEASETMEQPSKASQESSEAMQPPSEARDDADTPSSQKTPSVPSLNLSRRVSNSNLGGRQSPSSKASLTAKPPSPRAASSVKSTRPARAGSAK